MNHSSSPQQKLGIGGLRRTRPIPDFPALFDNLVLRQISSYQETKIKRFLLKPLPRLPIDDLIPSIIEELKACFKSKASATQILVKASPGSGKTTRLPQALLKIFSRKILVLEPRRLATKMSAMRVAEELRQSTDFSDDICGWQMRFDRKSTAGTRLLFITEGLFSQKVAEDPDLGDVDCVIIDEFHERHAETDIALALALQIQSTTRPDLVIIVMSATLQLSQLTSAMPKARVFELNLPIFPLEIIWWKGDPSESLTSRVKNAVQKIIQDSVKTAASQSCKPGDILVFLPGTAEIKRCSEALRSLPLQQSGVSILELRASLSKSEQEAVFSPSNGSRKLILATNIAESSLTIPGVTYVIDSGLARVPSFDFVSQVTTLETKSVCKASVIQRSGRAGRTGPGTVFRLFSENDFAGRPEHEYPEIMRSDLVPIAFNLKIVSARSGKNFSYSKMTWCDLPDHESWLAAENLLSDLRLFPEDRIDTSDYYLRLPLHPRLIRFLKTCQEMDLLAEGCWLMGILADQQRQIQTPEKSEHWSCDLLARYDSFISHSNQSDFFNPLQIVKQIASILRVDLNRRKPAHELDLDRPLVEAFFDKVAGRLSARNAKKSIFNLAFGGEAELDEKSSVTQGEFLIAWQIEASKVSGASQHSQTPGFAKLGSQRISAGSSISADAIRKYCPSKHLQKTSGPTWDEGLEKVRMLDQLKIGSLVLQTNWRQASMEESSTVLNQKILESWPKPFSDDQYLVHYCERVRLANEHGLTDYSWNYEELKSLFVSYVADSGLSFADIRDRSMSQWLQEVVGENEWKIIQDNVPEKMKIGAGFMVPIFYQEGKIPWIEARLQNFFGQSETPKIIKNKVSLTLHLLAPNQEALQITRDLANFWTTAYSSLRNEYMRRYPRHYWPENPLEAEPPVRGSLKNRK
ncbi:MAG: helicase-related protein [Proteobacteria bacterium]|nr:helicase-related protein [Pseudomonadota bacterium]